MPALANSRADYFSCVHVIKFGDGHCVILALVETQAYICMQVLDFLVYTNQNHLLENVTLSLGT